MALKKKISATAYEALSDVLKGEYKLVGEDYVLDVDGDEGGPTQADLDKVLQAKQHEKDARLKAERELKELKAAGQGAGEEAQTLKQQLEDLNNRLSARDNALKKSALENAASAVTAKSKFPNVLKPHVINRMQADIDEEGNAVVTILGADGKPSKLTVDQLTEEFKSNQEFEGLMLGSGSSGGDGGKPSGSGGEKPLKEMSEAERVAAAKSDPDGFRAKLAAESSSL